MTGKQPKPDDPEQAKRFEETARELGVDESGRAFTRVLRKIVPKAQKKHQTKR